METVSSISEAPHSYGPYPKAIRVLVVDTKEQDNNVVIGLADPTGAIKAICYEKKLVPKLQKNKSVLLRNFQKGRSCLIVNKTTQVLPSTPLKEIDRSILEQAKCLVTPPPPAVVALKDITLPPSGIVAPLLTVCGEVVQDEATHVVGQAAQEVRNIIIKQDETTYPVALWNKASHSPVKTGDKVTISHVSPRNDKYLRKLALSTTTGTTVTIHVPPPSTNKGTIVALEETDGSLSVTVLTNDDKLLLCTLPAPQTTTFLKGTIEDTLLHVSEVQYVFSLRGSTIEKLAPASSLLSTSTSGSTLKSSTQ